MSNGSTPAAPDTLPGGPLTHRQTRLIVWGVASTVSSSMTCVAVM